MIRNDLHVHSVQSLCGLHTIREIVQLGARKGMRLVAITDHGPSAGKKLNLGVLSDRRRLPDPVVALDGSNLLVLRGMEACIYDQDGSIDIVRKHEHRLDLICAGFHGGRNLPPHGDPKVNTSALERCLKNRSIDVLTHPCIATFPLELDVVVDLAVEHGFALEINNTNLRLGKTDRGRLERMIELAVDKRARVVECSDGHAYPEIGENDEIEELLERLGIDGNELLLNRDDEALDRFVVERRERRARGA